MKRLIAVGFTFALLLSQFALAQGVPQSDTQQPTGTAKMTSHAVTLAGKVSADGKMFVSDKDNKSWTVDNPDALKRHEGHDVTLKAVVDESKNTIHIASVKMAKADKKDEMPK